MVWVHYSLVKWFPWMPHDISNCVHSSSLKCQSIYWSINWRCVSMIWLQVISPFFWHSYVVKSIIVPWSQVDLVWLLDLFLSLAGVHGSWLDFFGLTSSYMRQWIILKLIEVIGSFENVFKVFNIISHIQYSVNMIDSGVLISLTYSNISPSGIQYKLMCKGFSFIIMFSCTNWDFLSLILSV